MRTLKEQCLYLHRFQSLAEACRIIGEFIARYNTEWLIERLGPQILAELGDDMSRFPTAAHAASWTGIGPGNHESAGKRKSGRTRKGNRWLRATLIECARGAVRARDSYLAAQYHRVARRRGDKKAIAAVAHPS
jgi:transposase